MALQPHLHLLVPEGVWSSGAFVQLPPTTQEEVAAVLSRTVQKLLHDFQEVEPSWPEDGFEALQLQGSQLRLELNEEPEPRHEGRTRRVAAEQGFSLHANTWVHPNDRAGLARLCRYGARGPIAESRLSRLSRTGQTIKSSVPALKPKSFLPSALVGVEKHVLDPETRERVLNRPTGSINPSAFKPSEEPFHHLESNRSI